MRLKQPELMEGGRGPIYNHNLLDARSSESPLSSHGYIVELAVSSGLGEMNPSESHLRIMIDKIPALAWSCLTDGTAEFFSKRWLDYTGLSLDEALGWGWQRPVHPEDLGNLTEKWRAVLDSAHPHWNPGSDRSKSTSTASKIPSWHWKK